jgi:hypothetical protein
VPNSRLNKVQNISIRVDVGNVEETGIVRVRATHHLTEAKIGIAFDPLQQRSLSSFPSTSSLRRLRLRKARTMDLSGLPEAVIDWSRTPATRTAVASAGATSRAHKTNGVQLRVVDYDPDYMADHWCSKGHILYVISGSLTIEHSDGTESYELAAGMSWQTADGGSPHRVRSICGASVFIVD